MSSELGGRVSYFVGSRPIERFVAFGATLVQVLWFLLNNHHLSLAAATGLLFGLIGTYFIRSFDPSAMTEGTLFMVVSIVVGIKYGLAAFGMYLVGWLALNIVTICLLQLSYRIFFGTAQLTQPDPNPNVKPR